MAHVRTLLPTVAALAVVSLASACSPLPAEEVDEILAAVDNGEAIDLDAMFADLEDPGKDDDADGLPNWLEAKIGTDRNEADSDGDGYPDGGEVRRGADPFDADSLIYKGGWPYQIDKASIEGQFGRQRRTADKNVQWPRGSFRDQFGDMVDLYDFAGHGKYIIVDLSSWACGPCISTATWLSSDESEPAYTGIDPIRDAVNSGDVYWLMWIYDDLGGTPSGRPDVKRWADTFPQDNVPVMADPNSEAYAFSDLGAWPWFIILDENMVVKQSEAGGGAGNPAMQWLVDRL